MDEEICGPLLEKAASGSAGALAELYAHAGRAVFAYALSIVRIRPIAEDVTQDVFVRIRLGNTGYTPRGQACGWLLRLTRNIALDAIKKQGHELSCEEPFVQWVGQPGEQTGALEDSLVLREALERLSESERQVVMLYLVAGVPQKEIAGFLKLPVTAVNWHYRAGLKKLARILKGEQAV